MAKQERISINLVGAAVTIGKKLAKIIKKKRDGTSGKKSRGSSRSSKA